MGIETVLIATAVASAASSAYAGKKAADASKQGAQASADTQRYMYDQTREDTAPYRQVGVGALNQLAAMYGIPTQQMTTPANDAAASAPLSPVGSLAQSMQDRSKTIGAQTRWGGDRGSALFSRALQDGPVQQSPAVSQAPAPAQTPAPSPTGPDFSAFYNSPDYQFAFDQGNRATQQAIARQGLTGSGAELKALTRFGQGLASQQLSNYTNRLASLAGVGQTATQQLGSLGVATGQGIGAAQQNAADARASSYLNTGAAINNAANSFGQYQLLKAGGYV